jgi:hypothetical protein
VAKVASSYAVAKFQGPHSDQEIGEWEAQAFSLFSPSICPTRRAIGTVTGWMGSAVSSSWISC